MKLSSPLPNKLTDSSIRAGASDQSFTRGQELYRRGAVSETAIQGSTLSGLCEGSGAPFYKVRAELDEGGVRSASCTCPYDFGGYCKHIVALLLAYARKPERFARRREPAEMLAELSREQLMALVTKLVKEQPELSERVEAALAAPSVSGGAKAPAKRRQKVDTEIYRRRVRGIMHSLDGMRMSEAYWHVGGLANELDSVRKTALEFLDAGEAEAALRILLTLVEESYDGFEYIDDSNGELGDFFSLLGETLAEVILSLDLNEEEREELVSDLDEPHERLSDYGVDGLHVAITAARYGWGETPRTEVAHDETDDDDENEEWDDDDEEDGFADRGGRYLHGWSPEDEGQILTRVKLNVLGRQGRTDDYLALCLKAGEHLRYALKLVELGRVPAAVSHALKRLKQPDEALALAQALRERKHLDEALRVGERGLRLGGDKAALGQWLGPIEETQGRPKQALEAWQAAFRTAPSLAAWETIKRLAGPGWKRLRPEVMASLEKFYDKHPLAEVLLAEQEWDAAIKVADKRGADHRVLATVADALIKHRPEWVIRASLKQAEELIAPTKSDLYPAAADWLRRAKSAYAQLKRTADWQKQLQGLKEKYRRRPALMAHLAKL